MILSRRSLLPVLSLVALSPLAHANDSPSTQPAAPAPAPAPTAAPEPAPTPAPPAAEVEEPAPAPEAPPPTPKDVAASVKARAHDEDDGSSAKPEDRPYFVKGEIAGIGVLHPMAKDDFIGASAGMSNIPSGFNTAINNYFLTVEPQIDLLFEHVKIGLGVPLQFGLADARGAIETCLDGARMTRDMGGSDDAVKMSAVDCLTAEKDKAIENFGKPRERDYDQPSDYAKVIRYLTIGGEERPFYLNVSRVFGQSLGHGTVVRRYNANLDYNTTRVGATLDAYYRFIGFESMMNDVINPDVLGVMGFVRPLEPLFTNITPLRSLSFGASMVMGLGVPRSIQYEKGVLEPSINLPIPKVDQNVAIIPGTDTETVKITGFDVETKLLRTQHSDLKVYFDVQKMVDHGSGYTIGSLWRFSFGKPAFMALRLRAEGYAFDADYLPSFFDGLYEIDKLQYIPAGYKSTAGNKYFPTKLGYLDAMKGGKKRLGGYLELTHSFMNLLTLGAAVTVWKPTGDPVDSSFTDPQFPDYAECKWMGTADDEHVDCTGVPTRSAEDKAHANLLLHVEIPFRRFLQAFATYEYFSTSIDKSNLFRLKGDNETLFAGVRLQILPLIYLQFEARKFYFLQRLTNIDLDSLRIEQDQNYHSLLTFGASVNAGLEF